MSKSLRWVCVLCLAAGVCSGPALSVAETTSVDPQEEQANKVVLASFYEGWNTHDADKMVSAYADDIDHINVFGEWHQGKAAIKEDIVQLHAGPGKNSHKDYTIEKMRFIKPDVAVVTVRSVSQFGGNIGTYVMTKDTGRWLVVNFTNVVYKVPEKK
jgi:uncharacterized protein (TIGR02246 family)